MTVLHAPRSVNVFTKLGEGSKVYLHPGDAALGASVSYFSVYEQVWHRGLEEVEDRELAAMSSEDRAAVLSHLGWDGSTWAVRREEERAARARIAALEEDS